MAAMKWIAMAVAGMVLGMVAAIIFVNVAGPQKTPRTERMPADDRIEPRTDPREKFRADLSGVRGSSTATRLNSARRGSVSLALMRRRARRAASREVGAGPAAVRPPGRSPNASAHER